MGYELIFAKTEFGTLYSLWSTISGQYIFEDIARYYMIQEMEKQGLEVELFESTIQEKTEFESGMLVIPANAWEKLVSQKAEI